MNKHATRGTVWHNLNYCIDLKNGKYDSHLYWFFKPSVHCAIMEMITKKGCECNVHCALCPENDLPVNFWLFNNNCYEYLFHVVK